MEEGSGIVRFIRNFTVIAILVSLVLAFFYYLTILLPIFLINGDFYVIKSIILSPIDKQFTVMSENFFKYWSYYIANYDKFTFSSNEYFALKLWISSLFPVTSLGILVFTFRAPLAEFRPFKKPESIHGDARWAKASEVRKMGLRKRKGAILGRYRGKFLITDDYQHTLLFAPTGSGKGVGFVIPNLLFWEESVICHDIKLENYELTSGWRKNHLKQKVFLWNPADPNGISHCYNPLEWVSDKPGKVVDDVQKIANFLLPKQEFWQNEARALITGVILYLLADDSKQTTLAEVLRTLRNDDVVYNLAVILDTLGKRIHPVAYMNIASYLQKPDKERGSVTSTANSALELWANPLIDTTTSSSDFDLNKFKTEPHTVYVGVTPDNIHRLKPLLGIFYQQSAAFFTSNLPKPEEKYGILMMMDEFPTLGKMEQFQSGIAYFRGYKVKLFLIVQDTQQLKGIYEDSGMNSFLSNSTYRVTFAANNVETANLISQLLGNKTAQQASYNRPKYLDLNPGARSLHVSKIQRALLLPQEVIRLPKEEQILLIESQPPIKSKKIKYYEDKFFKRRIKKKIPIPMQEPNIPILSKNREEKENKKEEDKIES